MWEKPIVDGPVTAELEEAVLKFYPVYDAEARYLIKIVFSGSKDERLSIIGSGIALGLIVLRAIVIKSRRQKLQRPVPDPVISTDSIPSSADAPKTIVS